MRKETPKILVHGFGPRILSGLVALKKTMLQDGVDSGRIHEISYRYDASYAQMIAEIGEKLVRIMERYPQDTQFDVFGYSLGTVTSLHAILDFGLTPRIRKYISVAGVEHGQHKPPALAPLLRSDIYKKLIPYNNNFISRFYKTHGSALASLEKHAVYSVDDKWLTPIDSNVFPDSNVVALHDIHHVLIGRSKLVAQKIKQECFDGFW